MWDWDVGKTVAGGLAWLMYIRFGSVEMCWEGGTEECERGGTKGRASGLVCGV
jgi:hypothetical protein